MYIGIDPGATGAIALYNPQTNALLINDMPYFMMTVGKTRKKRVDGVQLWSILQGFKDIGARMAGIESQGGRMGQGPHRAYALGWVAGVIDQTCVGLQIPMEHVPPSTWKKIMRAPKEKSASVQRAQELFPESAHLFRGPKGGTLDGRAEAAMLAYFVANKLQVPSTEVNKNVLEATSL